ncbi:MAG: hypothetical protein HYZ86_01810 [Candidatus Omnitrophica bacterium]|nr:hypothetical protein [Candidatus Omnitrophota bacterium]
MVLKKVKQSLFWFLKPDAVLDISSPGTRQMYVQQVLSCGRAEDIKELFKDIGPDQLRRSFEEMKRFLPKEVRMFWEDFFAGH